MTPLTPLDPPLTPQRPLFQVRLEVGPVDKAAREDINKFLREMVEESSTPGGESAW